MEDLNTEGVRPSSGVSGGTSTNAQEAETGTPQLILEEIGTRSKAIFESFDSLRSIVQRHEATIQKRWRKRNKEERLKVLLTAWGGPMSQEHRPDLEIFCKTAKKQAVTNSERSQALLYPQINQEDLIDSQNLLVMISARARAEPAKFANSDLETTRLGWLAGAFHPDLRPDYTMLFLPCITPSRYVDILAIRHDWDDETLFTGMSGIPIGVGVFILRIQQRILTFLVNCVKCLLQDLSAEVLFHAQVQLEPRDVPSTARSACISGIAERSYRSPSSFDFETLHDVLEAKMDEAKDHLLSLREDPAYFQSYMLQAQEHRVEILKGSNGQTHPRLRGCGTKEYWSRSSHLEIMRAYTKYEVWFLLHSQTSKLKQIQPIFKAASSSSDEIIKIRHDQLLKFRYCLDDTITTQGWALECATVSSPPWRSNFQFELLRCTQVDKVNFTLRSTAQLSKHEAEFQQYLYWLRNDRNRPFWLDTINIVEEIHRLLYIDPVLNSKITPYVAGILADLSITTQCLREIKLYGPWLKLFEETYTAQHAKLGEHFQKHKSMKGGLSTLAWDTSKDILGPYINLSQSDLRYPVNRARTKQNVDAMRLAEQNLDRFWTELDIAVLERIGHLLDGTALQNLLAEKRDLQRTPEWSMTQMSTKTAARTEGASLAQGLCVPLREMYLDLQQRTESTIDTQESFTKVKIKSKPKSDGRNISEETGLPNPANSIPASTVDASSHDGEMRSAIRLDDRALRVFKTIFFTPSTTTTPGEIRWTDFLHAMVSTGFAARQLQGSMWQFTPPQSVAKRSIIFHKPHPVPKISFHVARAHGRRLNRAYGWQSNTFVLASNSEDTVLSS